MAEDAVDAIVTREGSARPCRTTTMMLEGAQGTEAAGAAFAQSSLAADQRVHLLEYYGSAGREVLALAQTETALAHRLSQGLPVIAAEVVYACRAEQAVNLTDVMFLRTRVAALDARAADQAVPTAAALMARELGWDSAEMSRQRAAYDAQRDRESAWERAEALHSGPARL
jgi:glycerol-3-phosphate dehydrogenase